jgi:hypothetical protein
MIATEIGDEEPQKRDDEAYITWLLSTAKEIAESLKKLDPHRIKQIIQSYEQYRDHPAALHIPLDSEEEEAIKQLVGSDRLKDIILLKTSAFIFTPSILAPSQESLDFGTAMYRRFSLHGQWFSVIAVNETYLKNATKAMLRYMLEHELAQGEIYTDLAAHDVKNLSSDMKRTIHEEARIKAMQWSCISSEEMAQERHLIIDLTAHHPLVPVHFASASLFKYLEENWEDLQRFGCVSRNETEQAMETSTEKLAEWADFAINSFGSFLKELKKELTMTGTEYGIAIV